MIQPVRCGSDLRLREIDDSYEQLAELLVVVYREARIAVAGESGADFRPVLCGQVCTCGWDDDLGFERHVLDLRH